MLTILYIAGAPRSGSTVLDIVLGNHEAMASFGELQHLVLFGWIFNEYDSSGIRCRDVPFWNEVLERWTRRTGDGDLPRYTRLQHRFERAAALPRHLLEQAFRTRALVEYRRKTEALYEALAEASQRRILVDSSKAAVRGMALARMPGVSLRVVHLVRDGRGVLYSLKKSFQKDDRAGFRKEFTGMPTWRASLLWMVRNLLCEALVRQVGPEHSLRVRYEDLMADPGRELGRIGALVGVDLGPLAERIRQGEAFPASHLIAGNSLRMRGPMRMKLEEGWRQQLPPSDAHGFWRLAGWLARRYGYQR